MAGDAARYPAAFTWAHRDHPEVKSAVLRAAVLEPLLRQGGVVALAAGATEQRLLEALLGTRTKLRPGDPGPLAAYVISLNRQGLARWLRQVLATEPWWDGRDNLTDIRPADVKAALEDLHNLDRLHSNALMRLPGVGADGVESAAGLRDLLAGIVLELSRSESRGTAEAGMLLLDYYVKRVGSQEVVAQRLSLARPTFYRRLHRAFELVAQRLQTRSHFPLLFPS